MFFDSINKIQYQGTRIADISKRTAFVTDIIDNENFWFYYDLSENELPEHVAHDFYGRSDYHWILLLLNECYDPIYDWFLSTSELSSYVTKKYGAGNENATHHWELNGIKYNSNPGQNAIIVTNLEYEDLLNDDKRRIKVLYPEYISQIIDEYKKIVEGINGV